MSATERLSIDTHRTRWRRYRDACSLSDTGSGQFALGGLAAHAEPPDVRLIMLPSDPYAQLVPLDEDTAAWFNELRPSPYRRQHVPG